MKTLAQTHTWTQTIQTLTKLKIYIYYTTLYKQKNLNMYNFNILYNSFKNFSCKMYKTINFIM